MDFFKSRRTLKFHTESRNGDNRTSSNSHSLNQKPPNDEIDRLFEKAASRLNLSTSDVSVRCLTPDKKWFILCHENSLTSMGTVVKRKSVSGSHGSIIDFHNNQFLSNEQLLSPEYYIRMLPQRNTKLDVRCKLISDLSVRLRTMPVRWAQAFIEHDGIRALMDELAHINQMNKRNTRDCQLELEIIKCIRQLFGNYYGIQRIINDPSCIIILSRSILAPIMIIQRLVCEALTFICYFEQPKGHSIVIQGMDAMRSSENTYGRFDAWLKVLSETIDRRENKRMSGDIRHINSRNTLGPDMTEYALANMLLINALVDPDTVEDKETRITLRNQLYQGGLTQILERMCLSEYEPIHAKIEEFREFEEIDRISFMDIEDSTHPFDLCERIIASIHGTKAYDFFVSILSHLLVIEHEPEIRNRYYQLCEHFITQVVLDTNGSNTNFRNAYGLSVKDLISKFAEEDEVEAAFREADDAKEVAKRALENEAALRVQVDLKADGLVGKLRIQNEALERSIKVANQTNSVLQQRLNDIEGEHRRVLETVDSQMKKLLDTITTLLPQFNKTNTNEQFDSFNTIKAKIGKSINGELQKALLAKSNKDTQLNKQQKEAPVLQYMVHKETTPASPPSSSLSKESDTSSTISTPATISPTTPFIKPTSCNHKNNIFKSNIASNELTESPMLIAGCAIPPPPTPPPPPMSPPMTMPFTGMVPGCPPPPPPPPLPPMNTSLQCLPPPPPPPLLSSKSALVSPPCLSSETTSPITPKTKLKFVEWEKINTRQLGDTIWAHFEDRDEEDDDIEMSTNSDIENHLLDTQSIVSKLSQADVFTSIEKSFAQKPAIDLNKRRKKENAMVELLDAKKAHNMNIFLSSLSKTFDIDQLSEYIHQTSELIMNEHILESLLKFSPSKDEIKKLDPYKDGKNIERLSLADKLALEMIKITDYDKKIHCLLFKTTFWDTIHRIDKELHCLMTAAKSLRSAKRFKRLLQMILVLGNYMNGNTSRGGAFGIKIDSINKLIDTKSTNNSTLLHFLVETVDKSFPKTGEFLDELKYCEEASKGRRDYKEREYITDMCKKVNKIELMSNFIHIKNGLTRLTQDMSTLETVFSNEMKVFYAEASTKFNEVDELQKKTENSYKEVVTYYGENPQKMQPSEFFMIFHTFTKSWEKCKFELQRMKQARERNEVQKERRNQIKHNIQSKGKGIDMSDYTITNQDLIMDNLLEKLLMTRTDKTKEKLSLLRQQQHIMNGEIDASQLLQSMMDK
ncbi:hypothetical protein BDB01DRAFT_857818 [Pilobolus umbonatus]|nr:hypothetical protein BDB01DRAFT_857818 [Pilobolus umbonatus]